MIRENTQLSAEAERDLCGETEESAVACEEKKSRRKMSGWQKFNLVRNILALAFYCFYCVYFIVNKQGNVVVNYVLLASTAVYFAIFIIAGIIMGRKGKKFSGAGKRVYKVTRRLVLLINTVLTGGAIINMGAFASGLMIRVCAFIMIGNLILNVLWLIFSPRLERKYREKITSIKSSAKTFAQGLKSLFKKGFEGRREREIEADSHGPAHSVQQGGEVGGARRDEQSRRQSVARKSEQQDDTLAGSGFRGADEAVNEHGKEDDANREDGCLNVQGGNRYEERY